MQRIGSINTGSIPGVAQRGGIETEVHTVTFVRCGIEQQVTTGGHPVLDECHIIIQEGFQFICMAVGAFEENEAIIGAEESNRVNGFKEVLCPFTDAEHIIHVIGIGCNVPGFKTGHVAINIPGTCSGDGHQVADSLGPGIIGLIFINCQAGPRGEQVVAVSAEVHGRCERVFSGFTSVNCAGERFGIHGTAIHLEGYREACLRQGSEVLDGYGHGFSSGE